MNELVVRSGGVSLSVCDYGGSGPDVVLLHGLSSNVRIWDRVAGALAGRVRAVAFDQRGHGLSDPADDYGFEAVVADLRAVIAQLGLRDPLVVGHSWGASVALAHAAASVCPGVVCVDGGLFDLRARASGWEDIAARLRPPDMDGPASEVFAAVANMPSPIPWERREPVIARSFPVGEDGIARRKLVIDHHMRIVRAMYDQQLSHVHSRVACPVLFVMATSMDGEDPLAQAKREAAQQAAARLARMRVEWLASVHDMPLLHPEQVAAHIATFAAGPR